MVEFADKRLSAGQAPAEVCRALLREVLDPAGSGAGVARAATSDNVTFMLVLLNDYS